jgi:hypothetical protein
MHRVIYHLIINFKLIATFDTEHDASKAVDGSVDTYWMS